MRIGRGSDLAIAVVAQHEQILRVVEGEAFGDALDRFDQALPRQGDFAKIVRLDLDRRVAEHHQRAGHLGDLIAANWRGPWRPSFIGNSEHAFTGEPSDA